MTSDRMGRGLRDRSAQYIVPLQFWYARVRRLVAVGVLPGVPFLEVAAGPVFAGWAHCEPMENRQLRPAGMGNG